jgi:hypothetical protein
LLYDRDLEGNADANAVGKLYKQIAASKKTTNLKRSTGARRVAKIAAAETAGKGYRADLRSVSCPMST